MIALPTLDLVALSLSLVTRATLLLLLGASVHAVASRHASAATRHLVWTAVMLGLLVLPALSLLLPAWRIRAPAAAPAWTVPAPAPREIPVTDPPGPAPVAPAEVAPAGAPRPVSAAAVLLTVYLAGVALLLGRLGVERWTLRRLTGSAEPVDDSGWAALLRDSRLRLGVARPVTLLRSRWPVIPMTCGTRRPVILIPSNADEWSRERRRAVVLHEMAHVARADCLVQAIAALATSLYWFHPGVWWAAERLRVERELACDDRVIGAGIAPRAYARHLLEIARSLRVPREGALALSMARPSQLEGRMVAALDGARARSAPGLVARHLFGWTAALLLAGVASAEMVGGAAVAAVEGPAPAALAGAAPPAGGGLAGPTEPSPPIAGSTLADADAPETGLPAVAPDPFVPLPEPRLADPCAGPCRAPPGAAGIIRVARVDPPPAREPALDAAPARGTRTAAPAYRRRNDLITREEIDELGMSELYAVVRTVRSAWLRTRPGSFGESPGVQVYLDGQRLGGTQALGAIPTAGVVSIRFYGPAEASSRWGLDHGEGAIYVSSR